jgi:hypothetical protein
MASTVMLLTCAREVFDMNLIWDTNYPELVVVFLSPSKQFPE